MGTAVHDPGKSQIVAAAPNPERLLHAAELVAGRLESSLRFPLAAKGIRSLDGGCESRLTHVGRANSLL